MLFARWAYRRHIQSTRKRRDCREREREREREMWRGVEWEERCRKHFEHKLSKGVCPCCLREKLIHLSASSSASTTANASSSASSASSASSPPAPAYFFSGSAASPPRKEPSSAHDSQELFRENMGAKSEAAKKTARSFSSGIKEKIEEEEREREEEKEGRKEEEEEENQEEEEEKKKDKEKKKKRRFWAKLLHSKTMKEKGSTKWIFF